VRGRVALSVYAGGTPNLTTGDGVGWVSRARQIKKDRQPPTNIRSLDNVQYLGYITYAGCPVFT